MSDATQAQTKKEAAGNGSAKAKAEKEPRQLQTFATLGGDFTGPAPDESLTDGSADGWNSGASSVLSHEPSTLLLRRSRVENTRVVGLPAVMPTFGGRNFCGIPTHARTRPAVQPKLTVGAAHDPAEQEADQVAEQVMRMPVPVAAPPGGADAPKPSGNSIQRAAEEEEIQTKPLAATIRPWVQRAGLTLNDKDVQRAAEEEDELQTKRVSAVDSFEVGSDFEDRVATTGGGSPLPAETRAFMEPRFNMDFSGVRVHAGSEAADLNRQVSAQAFTLGRDIYLGEGQTDVASDDGKRLLAHELTHVVQQGGAGNLGRKVNRCASAGCRADEALLKLAVQRQIAEPIARGSLSSLPIKINRCATGDCFADEALLKRSIQRQATVAGVEPPPASAPTDSDKPKATMPALPVAQAEPKDGQEKPVAPVEPVAPSQPSPAIEPEASKAGAESEPATTALPVTDAANETVAASIEPESEAKPGEVSAAISGLETAPLIGKTETPEAESKDAALGGKLRDVAQSGAATDGLPDLSSLPLDEAWQAAKEHVAKITAEAGQIAAPAAPELPAKTDQLIEQTAPPKAPQTELMVATPATDSTQPTGELAGQASAAEEQDTLAQDQTQTDAAQPEPEAATAEASAASAETSGAADPSSTATLVKAGATETGAPVATQPPTPEAVPAAATESPAVKTPESGATEALNKTGGEKEFPLTSSPDKNANAERFIQRSPTPNVQHGLLEDLIPGWVQGALNSLRGDAGSKKGELSTEGGSRSGQVNSASQTKGGEIAQDGQTKGGEVETDGQAKGADLEGDQSTKGTELEGDQSTKGAELEGDKEAKGTELEGDQSTKGAELEGDKEAKGGELQNDAQAKGAEVTSEADARSVQLETDAAQKNAEVETLSQQQGAALQQDYAKTKGGAAQLQTDIEQQLQIRIAAVQNQADAAKTQVETRQQELMSAAESVINDLCQLLKTGAQAALDILNGILDKWNEFANWVRTEIWPSVKKALEDVAAFVSEKAAAVRAWLQEAWAWLSARWANAEQIISEKAEAARTWISGRAQDARDWINGKAQSARDWIDGKAQSARDWIDGRAQDARTWIDGQAQSARTWIDGQAQSARTWIDGQAQSARTWIDDKAQSARTWIDDKTKAAQTWLEGRADAVANGFETTANGFVSGMGSFARGAVSSISSGGGPIMQWFGGIVNSLISGVESAANSAVGAVSGALRTGLNFVENKVQGALSFLSEKATGAVNWVQGKATGAVNWVQGKATGAVKWVQDKATGAVNWVQGKATGAVNWVQGKAIGAVNWVQGKATGAVNWVQDKAIGAVNLLERAGKGAVTLVERGAIAAVQFVKAAWENIKAGWEIVKAGADAVLKWVRDRVDDLRQAIEQNIIQPISDWLDAHEEIKALLVGLKNVIEELFIDKPGVWDNDDFWVWYFTGGGATVNLADVGLLEAFKNAPDVQQKISGLKETIQERIRNGELEPGTEYSQDLAVRVTEVPGLFVLGHSNIKATYICQEDSGAYTCAVTYSMEDRFEDPLDLANMLPSPDIELPCGTPYTIKAEWTENFRLVVTVDGGEKVNANETVDGNKTVGGDESSVTGFTVSKVEFTNSHPMEKYGTDDPKYKPVWVPGAIDHAVAYTKGTQPSGNAEFDLNGTPPTTKVSISIRVKYGNQVLNQTGAISMNGTKISSGFSLPNLPGSDAVRAERYELGWEWSLDGKNWRSINNTGRHLVYWVYNTPLENENFAINKATGYVNGNADVVTALRSGLNKAVKYDSGDEINEDPLSVYDTNKGVCADFANLLSHLSRSIGLSASVVLIWGGFKFKGRDILVEDEWGEGSHTLEHVQPGDFGFKYHVISNVEGTQQDAALDRTGVEAQAVQQGKSVRLVEPSSTTLPPGKVGTFYNEQVERIAHPIDVTSRDYGKKIDVETLDKNAFRVEVWSTDPDPYDALATYGIAAAWFIIGKPLPEGLRLNVNGQISGTPTQSGTFRAGIKVEAIRRSSSIKNTFEINLTIEP
jgi:hypothetical protein